MSLNIRSVSIALLLCLICPHGWAAQDDQRQQNDQQQSQQAEQKQTRPAEQQSQAKKSEEQKKRDQKQMRGLDEEVQNIKSDVLRISAELRQLEEKLMYPSGTEIAIFVALAKGESMRLDAVRLQIDGQLVAHYIYSAKELEALRKGGVQRVYVGNVTTGDHELEVIVDGKLENGEDYSRTQEFSFSKEVKPKLVELTLASPSSGSDPISLGEW